MAILSSVKSAHTGAEPAHIGAAIFLTSSRVRPRENMDLPLAAMLSEVRVVQSGEYILRPYPLKALKLLFRVTGLDVYRPINVLLDRGTIGDELAT